jgi:hypothetical protein
MVARILERRLEEWVLEASVFVPRRMRRSKLCLHLSDPRHIQARAEVVVVRSSGPRGAGGEQPRRKQTCRHDTGPHRAAGKGFESFDSRRSGGVAFSTLDAESVTISALGCFSEGMAIFLSAGPLDEALLMQCMRCCVKPPTPVRRRSHRSRSRTSTDGMDHSRDLQALPFSGRRHQAMVAMTSASSSLLAARTSLLHPSFQAASNPPVVLLLHH